MNPDQASISTPKKAPVRVVIVDDHAGLRDMLACVLKMEGGYEVVGQASGGVEGLRVCRALEPQVVIVDLALPELSGVHVVRVLLHEEWKVRVVVYTGAADEAMMRDALAEEPDGFVRKEDTLPELREALRAVMAGGRYISKESARMMPPTRERVLEKLTPQERAVLQMLAEGKQGKEMAEALGTTQKTVEHHRQNMMDKLGLHDVASLVRYAIRHRLVAV